MRLLKILEHEGGNLHFEFVELPVMFSAFYTGTSPDYVAVSTTRDDKSDEVSYREMRNDSSSAKKKSSFQDIEICAREALRHGIHHIWAYSCCVDELDNHEVDYATNNKFHIYRGAQFFCVILRDYTASDRIVNEEDSGEQKHASYRNVAPSSGSFETGRYLGQVNIGLTPQPPKIDELKKSEWFTSGWMLQELIAPTDVKFFDQKGSYLGDKKSMRDIICEATKLPPSALDPYRGYRGMWSFSVEERWSWAESLKFPREEDRAYCMLGIFGVNMTIRYGEGEAAMDRLLRLIAVREALEGRKTDAKSIQDQPQITAEQASNVNKRIQESGEKQIAIYHPNTKVASALARTVIAAQQFSERVPYQRWGSVSTCYISAESGAQNPTYTDVLLELVANLLQSSYHVRQELRRLYLERDTAYLKNFNPLDESTFVENMMTSALAHLQSIPRRVVIVTDFSNISGEITSKWEMFMEKATEDSTVKWITTTTNPRQPRLRFEWWESNEPAIDGTDPDIRRWTTTTMLESSQNPEQPHWNQSTQSPTFVEAFTACLGESISPDYFPDNSEYSYVLLDLDLRDFLERIRHELALDEQSKIHKALLSCEARHVIRNIRLYNRNDQVATPEATRPTQPAIASTEKKYISTISNTGSFKWLSWRVQTYAKLDYNYLDGCNFRYDILRRLVTLPQENVVSKNYISVLESIVNIQFNMDWDIQHFHKIQEYSCSVPDMLGKAIVVSRRGLLVQATTCREYVEQTWGCEGVELLSLLQQALSRFLDGPSLDHAVNPTELDSSKSRHFEVVACDSQFCVFFRNMPAYTMIVAAELLTWLHVVLREASDKDMVHGATSLYRVPLYYWDTASDKDMVHGATSLYRVPLYYWDTQYGNTLEISAKLFRAFDTTYSPGADGSSCWKKLFNRRVATTDQFPVPRRAAHVDGLEVSLEVMATLAGTTYLVNFCGRTYIKGFSTMLAVTEVTESFVFWHFLYNEDSEKYISYADPRLPPVELSSKQLALNYSGLKKRRHILGWSPKAVSIAGGNLVDDGDKSHDVQLSSHHDDDPGGTILSPGQRLLPNSAVALGTREMAFNLGMAYFQKLQALSHKHFLFYDTEGAKTWLVRGSLALLHLLRCHIHYVKTQDYGVSFLPTQSALSLVEQAPNMSYGSVCYEILRQCQEIQLDKSDGSIKLSTKVEDICDLVYQIWDYFADVREPSGIVRLAGLPQMRGFDFRHVAAAVPGMRVKSRLEVLDPASAGWGCLVQHLECIPLFGAGFGELIQHVSSECTGHPPILQPPDTRGLLHVSVEDILRAMGSKVGDAEFKWGFYTNISWDVELHAQDNCTRAGCLNRHKAWTQIQSKRHDSIEVQSKIVQTTSSPNAESDRQKKFDNYIRSHIGGAIVLGMSKEDIEAKDKSRIETVSHTPRADVAVVSQQYSRSPSPQRQPHPLSDTDLLESSQDEFYPPSGSSNTSLASASLGHQADCPAPDATPKKPSPDFIDACLRRRQRSSVGQRPHRVEKRKAGNKKSVYQQKRSTNPDPATLDVRLKAKEHEYQHTSIVGVAQLLEALSLSGSSKSKSADFDTSPVFPDLDITRQNPRVVSYEDPNPGAKGKGKAV